MAELQILSIFFSHVPNAFNLVHSFQETLRVGKFQSFGTALAICSNALTADGSPSKLMNNLHLCALFLVFYPVSFDQLLYYLGLIYLLSFAFFVLVEEKSCFYA